MKSNRLDATVRRWRTRGPIALVAACILALTLPSMLMAQRTATLVGRVTDTTGTAITHAVLRVSGLPFTVLADANGGYRIALLPAGSQTVIARAFGFEPETLVVTL